jgi:hypothetical protein
MLPIICVKDLIKYSKSEKVCRLLERTELLEKEKWTLGKMFDAAGQVELTVLSEDVRQCSA